MDLYSTMKKPHYETNQYVAAALAYAKISDWARVSHMLLEIEQKGGKIERTKRARTIHNLLEIGGELAAPTKELWNKLLMRNASPAALEWYQQLQSSGHSRYSHVLLPARNNKSSAKSSANSSGSKSGSVQAKPLQLSDGSSASTNN
jgi:hypothetical protein